jgi:PKD repeat protein
VTGGSLPAGLALSSGGVLSGTPTTAGAYSFTVTATNAAGNDTQTYSGSVAALPLGDLTSVFDPALPFPHTLSVADQPAVDGIFADGFYTYNPSAAGARVVGARLFVPAGVGVSQVTLYLFGNSEVLGSAGSTTRFSTGGAFLAGAPTQSVVVPITGTGWVEGFFTTPWTMTVNAVFHIGYKLGTTGTKVIYADGPTAFVTAHDTFPLVLAESTSGGQAIRSWQYDFNVSNGQANSGRMYGVDVILEKP